MNLNFIWDFPSECEYASAQETIANSRWPKRVASHNQTAEIANAVSRMTFIDRYILQAQRRLPSAENIYIEIAHVKDCFDALGLA